MKYILTIVFLQFYDLLHEVDRYSCENLKDMMSLITLIILHKIIRFVLSDLFYYELLQSNFDFQKLIQIHKMNR